MKEILKQLSINAILKGEIEVTDEQRDSQWLGNKPATSKEIYALEKRLGKELPADYVLFLETCNGFAAPAYVESTFHPTTEVDYLKNIDAELIDIWRETGNEEVADQLERSICVAGREEDQMFLLIPPKSSGSSWQYWKFAHWIPGEEIHESLKHYFEYVSSFLHDEYADDLYERKENAKSYLKYLAGKDLESLLDLFHEDGTVLSPLYGPKPYKEFFTELFEDTENSNIQLQGIFQDDKSGHVAIHFTYKWTLNNGEKTEFEVVDILEFDDMHKITKLTIIYDATEARQKLDRGK